MPQPLGASELQFGTAEVRLESAAAQVGSAAAPAESNAAGRRVRSDATVVVIACGAIAQPCMQIVESRGLPVDVVPLPPLLHNRPDRIADAVERLVGELSPGYDRVVVGYADCGTYGALDEVCQRMGVSRLSGLHCYDVYAGADRMAALFDEHPGTYVLTDFLVRSFARTVLGELGLDRYPELRDSYFGHYTRVVWLAQQPDDEIAALAEAAANAIGLPLVRIDVGSGGLEAQLVSLCAAG